ncbi:hypothetical protein B0H14DRAFT_3708282 [Mycena olivaceomarginata]|nr:hypothetical protein B0H14DRAFT_3708282 [Mycena olivaceomarginata]
MGMHKLIPSQHSSRDSTACSNAPTEAADMQILQVARPAFPFVGWQLPFDRFTFQSVTNGEEDAAHGHLYNTFTWMGRAAFPLLVDAVTRLRPNGAHHAAFFRGFSGVGKSHLLAALVLCLRHQGKTVVYIPDCQISQGLWRFHMSFNRLEQDRRSSGHDCRLPNLEHPEPTFSWSYDPKDWDSAYDAFALDRTPLAKLRTVRLRGYLRRGFVPYICRGAPGITDLELALLDRPIGSCLVDERQNPPPKWRDDEKDDDNEVDGDGDEDAASDNGSVAGEYDHEECIAPRALSTFDGVDLTAQFPALTRLSLCRPTESTNSGVQDAYVSVDCDIGILEEWAALIRATRGTLEHLILAQEIEMDSTGNAEFLAMFPYGPGYARFVEHCLPALLEENNYSSSQPQKLVEARFKPMGVDVRSSLGRRMMYEDHNGVIRRGDGCGESQIDLEEEEEEEEGEGEGEEDEEEEEEEEEEEFIPPAEADPDGLSVLVY